MPVLYGVTLPMPEHPLPPRPTPQLRREGSGDDRSRTRREPGESSGQDEIEHEGTRPVSPDERGFDV